MAKEDSNGSVAKDDIKGAMAKEEDINGAVAKEDTNGAKIDGIEIEEPRMFSKKCLKGYRGGRRVLISNETDEFYYSGRPPLRPLDGGYIEENEEPVLGDGDPSMCNYCWLKADHELEMCLSRYDEPMPCPGPDALPRYQPILNIKENAIENAVFIDQLSEDANAEKLLKLFGVYGHVTEVAIPTDVTTGLLKNCGLVVFRNIDDAEKALNSLNEKGFHVEWYVSEGDIVYRTGCHLQPYYYCP